MTGKHSRGLGRAKGLGSERAYILENTVEGWVGQRGLIRANVRTGKHRRKVGSGKRLSSERASDLQADLSSHAEKQRGGARCEPYNSQLAPHGSCSRVQRAAFCLSRARARTRWNQTARTQHAPAQLSTRFATRCQRRHHDHSQHSERDVRRCWTQSACGTVALWRTRQQLAAKSRWRGARPTVSCADGLLTSDFRLLTSDELWLCGYQKRRPLRPRARFWAKPRQGSSLFRDQI